MDFSISPEQRSLLDVARGIIGKAGTLDTLRRTPGQDDPFNRALWDQFANEVGLHSILVPEDQGGAGGDLTDVAVVAEELGRGLVAGPYLTSAVYAIALMAKVGKFAEALLTDAMSGASITSSSLDHADPELSMAGSGPDRTVSGSLRLVPFGDLADVFLGLTRAGDVVAVRSGDRVRVESGVSVDPSQRFATVHFDDAPAFVLAEGETARDAAREARAAVTIALCAERVGAARRCAEMMTEYAKTRHQFGRAIGSFQSIKHLIVDVAIEVEYAATATSLAAWDAAHGGCDEQLLRAAAAQSTEALLLAATTNVQVHGGIAITWEHDAHLYLKRALATRPLLGAPSELYREAAAAIELAQ